MKRLRGTVTLLACIAVAFVITGCSISGCSNKSADTSDPADSRRDANLANRADQRSETNSETNSDNATAGNVTAGNVTAGNVTAGDVSSPSSNTDQHPDVAAVKLISKSERDTFIAEHQQSVTKFCADCHAMPRPTSSSIEEWRAEVEQGFMLYQKTGRTDLAIPNQEDTLKFFQYQAPEVLRLPRSIEGYPDSPLALRQESVRFGGNRPPGVTNVKWLDIGIKDSPALVYCDIGSGMLVAHWPQLPSKPTERIATLFQPVHVEACDLDSDGQTDLVVADIGEFNADDSDLGRVVWLQRAADAEKFNKTVLLDGLSRVSDVQPGDFDGDGDTDLLVAVFGWRNTGNVLLMTNEGNEDGKPRFSTKEIDPRHGAVNMQVVDLDSDGDLDFVGLISQEHESVEAYFNDSNGNFTRQLIYAAPDPAYGSSGIELADMDSDGDLDVLFTNGDSFDRGPKPYHSVQWLENAGAFPYQRHEICLMPGVINAKARDLDSDGDLDIVAVALLAEPVNDTLQNVNFSSVVLLTQTKPGVFEPSRIEGRQHQHLSVELADFDGDGKTDIAVGNFLRTRGADQADVLIWYQKP